MSLASFRSDLVDLTAPSGALLRPLVAVGTLAIVVATGVVYALPFDESTDTIVSDASFVLLALLVILVSARRAIVSTGGQRTAWFLVAASFVAIMGLFAIDPSSPDKVELSLAVDAAVLPSLAFGAAVITLARPALPGLATLRAGADAVWVTAALVVATWPWTVDPIVAIEGRSSALTVLHLSFAFTTMAVSTTVLVLIPHSAGRGRISLWFLGVGGAITSAAGLFHIRFWAEGTLRFGSWWDYLWTVGLAALVFAPLTTVEGELRPRRRRFRWNALMTALPIMLAAPALVRTDGSRVAALLLLVALGGRVLALLAENERLTDSLRSEAHNDPLTGLGNRRALDAGLRRIGNEAAEAQRSRAVAVIDLDHFKLVNDAYGHLVGDEVLRLVARRLRDAVRDQDVLARHGGDEFMAVMVVRHEREAERAAERIRAAVEGRYAITQGTVEIGATIGVALDDGRGEPGDLVAAADVALYGAKTDGRGSIRVSGDSH